MKNTFACAGPEWESLYMQCVKRNTFLAAKYRQHLVPINYQISVSSLELGDLSGCEVTLCAPGTSETFRHSISQVLLKAGAAMVAAVSDVGSISVYRSGR